MTADPNEVIRIPLADLDEESGGEQHDCNVCHGEGAFACSGGCHTRDCDECDGSGRLDADDNPVPANEVRY